MNKIRILIANAPEEIGGVTAWRMFWPIWALEHSKYVGQFEIRYSRGTIFPFELYQTDILICFRPSRPDHLQVIAEAKRVGCKILIDYDDNHRDIPTGHPAYWTLGQSWKIATAAAEMANAIWVSTEPLKTLFDHPKKTTVIPNAIFPELLPMQPTPFDNRVGVWAGSDAHRDDVDAYKDTYRQLLRELDTFYWINYRPTWGDSPALKNKTRETKIHLAPWVHTEEYFTQLKKFGTTVIWKPLQRTQFNDCKSNIALIAATVAGGVCVTPYAGLLGWEYAQPALNAKTYAETWRRSADDIANRYNLYEITETRAASLLQLANT